MVVSTLPMSLLQIFYRMNPNYEVIVKSITGPDDNFYLLSMKELINQPITVALLQMQAWSSLHKESSKPEWSLVVTSMAN